MTNHSSNPQLLCLDSPAWEDYALLDSGDGQKLEQYGPYRLVRPEAEALWHPTLPVKEWNNAHAIFHTTAEENGGHWENRKNLPESWQISYKDLQFRLQTTASRHVGVFPEQASQWDWIDAQIRRAGREVSVLNLFGYTGLASLAAARAGARVTHVDASRKVLDWAKHNQQLSGLEQRPIRWIMDDAVKFVQRENRRASRYDGIILDPPKFGRGPKGEVWEFYKLLPELLHTCQTVLSNQPCFLVLTAYAVKASALTLRQAVLEMMTGHTGVVECGEVVLREQSADRILSMAVFARWKTNH